MLPDVAMQSDKAVKLAVEVRGADHDLKEMYEIFEGSVQHKDEASPLAPEIRGADHDLREMYDMFEGSVRDEIRLLHDYVRVQFSAQAEHLRELSSQLRKGSLQASQQSDGRPNPEDIDFSRLDRLLASHGLDLHFEKSPDVRAPNNPLEGVGQLLAEHGIIPDNPKGPKPPRVSDNVLQVPLQESSAPSAESSQDPRVSESHSVASLRSAQQHEQQEDGDSKNPPESPHAPKRDSSRFSFVRSQMVAQQRVARAAASRVERAISLAPPQPENLSLKDRIGQVVASNLFVYGIMTLIFINLLMLGIEVEISASLGTNDIPQWFEIVNLVIVVIFVLEITLKFFAFGCRKFFLGPDGHWNMFDLVIILLSVLETALDGWAASQSASQVELSHLRVMRFMRLARTLRGIRVIRLLRYVGALRTLVFSILNTMKSLLWTLILLCLLFYSFGVVLTQLVQDQCRYEAIAATGNTNAVPHCEDGVLHRYWSSIFESMLTLFMAISGGLSWGEALDPLKSFSLIAVACMVFYVLIAVFAVMNVVTGVFCNTAIESANSDRDIRAIEQLNKQTTLVKSLKELFQEIDHDNSNMVSIDEFRTAVNTPKMSSFLESMGISTQDVWTLFTIIDADSSGLIDLDEFVGGCMELHGPAKSFQMSKMSYENKITRQAIKKLVKETSDVKNQLVFAVRALEVAGRKM